MIKLFERMPTKWIASGGLKKFRWEGNRADNIAALLTYLVLVQNTHYGVTRITYTDISLKTHLSREKVAQGLKILIGMQLISKEIVNKTASYKIANYGAAPWGKTPVSALYDGNGPEATLRAFRDFHLRSKRELDAIKLYFCCIARRDGNRNAAMMSYATINTYTGIARGDIRSAISLLINCSLIQLDQIPSQNHANALVNMYRICGIDSTHHRGTKGRIDPDTETYTSDDSE